MFARKMTIALAVVATLGLTACNEKDIPKQAAGDVGPKTVVQVSNIPDWYVNPPKGDEDYLYVAGAGLSGDLSMSVQKATLDAQFKLADKLQAKLNGLMEQYKADVNDASIDNTELTIKKIVADTSVVGYNVEKQAVQNEGRNYRTFILIKYPLGEANTIVQRDLAAQAKKAAMYRAAEQRNKLDKELAAKRERDAAEEARLQAVLAPSTVEDAEAQQ